MDIYTIWFVLIGLLLLIYSSLEGFDLGCGIIALFVRKSDPLADDKRFFLTNAIAPVWDENEVWIIAAIGGMFAAFPNAYAAVFSGFYLAVMLLLIAIIFRAISLEVRSKVNSALWKKSWDMTFGISSLLIPLVLGVALGNVILGIPLDVNLESNISFFELFRPFPLLMGIAVVALFYFHGSLFAHLKAPEKLQAEMLKTVKRSGFILLIAYLVLIAGTAIFFLETKELFVFSLPILLLVSMIWLIRKNYIKVSFLLSVCFIVINWLLVGIYLFPNLVYDINGVNHITMYNAASSPDTLKNMLIIAAIGVPIVMAYTVFLYRVFRGRVELDN